MRRSAITCALSLSGNTLFHSLNGLFVVMAGERGMFMTLRDHLEGELGLRWIHCEQSEVVDHQEVRRRVAAKRFLKRAGNVCAV